MKHWNEEKAMLAWASEEWDEGSGKWCKRLKEGEIWHGTMHPVYFSLVKGVGLVAASNLEKLEQRIDLLVRKRDGVAI